MNLFLGADEVGRGAFAGPVCAGAVIMPPDIEKAWNDNTKSLPVVIKDSKKMTPLQRQKSSVWIIENAISYGIGEGSCELINTAGIMEATYFAFRSAIAKATKDRQHLVQKLYIDALVVPKLDYFSIAKQEAILHGEDHSVHIAAASIISKVHRDKLMENLSRDTKYTNYGWEKNKGYGTKQHIEAIRQYGICEQHRIQYVTSSFSRALS